VQRALGIRYARAARFALPESLPWNGDVAGAGALGPSVPQLPSDDLVPGMAVGPTDESDCLSLNVWAPADAAGLPVLVWFHGGSFVVGSSAQACHDGARLAREQDVVVVTVNYRLGALGFLDMRAIGGDVANLGLHDALTALAWVRENISAFGGDPSRVTVFGLSAGGGLGIHLLASGMLAGLASGVIVQSGITDRTLDAEHGALVAKTMCTACGVGGIDALAAVPIDRLLAAQAAVVPELLKPVGMMPFHPCVDGELLTAAPAAAFRAGIGREIPLVAGTTSEEMNLFLDPRAPVPDRDRLIARTARYVGVADDVARRIVARYEADVGPDDVWPALFSDVEMQVPLRRVVEARSAAEAPTHTYLFAWTAPERGAFHAIDLPFVFDAFDVDGWGEFVGADADAARLGREVRASWAAFARAGDPGWRPAPCTHVFARASHDASSHPLWDRQQDYWAG
jgi:para-nitrobenzyl esterase